jgi:signal transduction histidine kinase
VTNQKLQNSLNSLEKEQEENKRMTKIIAHDLRSPVASIMGLVNLLNTDELSKEDMRTYLNLAEKSGQKALAFITSVLNTSVDKHATDKQLIDLGELLISCIQINSIQAQRKKQQVTYTPSEVMVSVNEGNIWRVFNNIISKGYKYASYDYAGSSRFFGWFSFRIHWL